MMGATIIIITKRQYRKLRLIESLLEQAVTEGVITCPNCGHPLEPDAERCLCGWVNKLREGGYI